MLLFPQESAGGRLTVSTARLNTYCLKGGTKISDDEGVFHPAPLAKWPREGRWSVTLARE